MAQFEDYPVGQAGVAWGDAEKRDWLAMQTTKRSYADDIEARIKVLGDRYDVQSYGELRYPSGPYTLYALGSKNWNPDLPSVLVTGGVHGYETSGVLGALRFLETAAGDFAKAFNFLVLPCISPWAYETINRWNPFAVDPNRSFLPDGAAAEATLVMDYLSRRSTPFLAHFDLHETTDTDNSEFRPALAARDAIIQRNWDIPDGFYLVADTTRPANKFQTAIIQSVEKKTHIAPSNDGKIIGEKLQQRGVICYDAQTLGLCMGFTDASYVTTTEVYPDSPRVTGEDCVAAQVAAVSGGLWYLSGISD